MTLQVGCSDPPPAAPVITSSRPDLVNKEDDIVTTDGSVSSSVTVNIAGAVEDDPPPEAPVITSSRPDIVNKEDDIVTTDGSVSSSVTVNIAGAVEDVMYTGSGNWSYEMCENPDTPLLFLH
nr:hypothetical protein BaRGS_022157 [Batillaria attramentaria]